MPSSVAVPVSVDVAGEVKALVGARVDDRRGIAGARTDQAVDDQLVRQRGDEHLPVRDRRRTELREVAERVPRGVLLTVPELARHVAGVVGAQDPGCDV